MSGQEWCEGVVGHRCDRVGTAPRMPGQAGHRDNTHPVLAASFLEGAQQHGSAAALLEVGGHILPGDAGCPTLVGARHGVPGTLVLVVLGRERGCQLGLGAGRVRVPRGSISPGWCQRRTPWSSRCRAGCAWGTRTGRAGTAGAASCGPHTCSHSTRSPGDTCPGGPGDHNSVTTLWLPSTASPDRDGDAPRGHNDPEPTHPHPQQGCPSYGVSHSVPIQAVSPWCPAAPWGAHTSQLHPMAPWPAVLPTVFPLPTYLEGLPSEVAGAELALDPALGAAVLDVLGEVTAAQFGAAPVGAGDHIEATGAEMGLEDTGMVMERPQGTILTVPHPRRSYLEVFDEPAPAAALLAVDAANGQAQHLRLQLGVRVDLEGQQWGISILHRAPGAHSPQHSLAGSLGHAARGRIPPGHTNKRPLSGASFRSPARGTKGSCFRPGARARPAWLCQALCRAWGWLLGGDVPVEQGTHHVPGSPWRSPGAAGPLGT